jgi:hypothetical protein
MKKSKRSRLNERSLDLFPKDSLFDKIARACCHAGCLPRKELYEAWEVARRTRREFRGGRVVDLACGHGLLAQIMLILDSTSLGAIAVDHKLPLSCQKLHNSLIKTWPRLENSIDFIQADLAEIELNRFDLVVSAHACGKLSDTILDKTIQAGARLALLPCCHDLKTCDPGGLTGWMDGPLAIDTVRVERLRQNNYTVMTRTIPEEITPKNRLILAKPKNEQ